MKWALPRFQVTVLLLHFFFFAMYKAVRDFRGRSFTEGLRAT